MLHEYAVQRAIENISIRAGSTHFLYKPDILKVFTFYRLAGVSSISSDGKTLPKLYEYTDTPALSAGSSRVSAISKINGQEPYSYLKATAYSQYIDNDGRVNNLLAHGDTDYLGSFLTQQQYDGDLTRITWANGTSRSFKNRAVSGYGKLFSTVTDGPSFFETFCTGAISGKEGAQGRKRATPVSTGEHRHHQNKREVLNGVYSSASPVAQSSGLAVAGYFLSDQGYEDVAVLKMIGFDADGSSTESRSQFFADFQATIKSFISQCVSNNKKKLIIDLRQNQGGSGALQSDAFMQIFPDIKLYDGARYRASDVWNKIGSAVNEIRSNPALAKSFRDPYGGTIENSEFYRMWSWWNFLTVEGKSFDSWDQYKGPLTFNSDKFSVGITYNYSNSNPTSLLESGFFFVKGQPSPFQPSNVVMFTDTLCVSACAHFHEEMKNIAGVRSVTVGGLPEKKPIQAVTGTRGGEITFLTMYQDYAKEILKVSSDLNLASVKSNDTALSAIANVSQVLIRVGDNQSRIQALDQIRKGDTSGTPLQYVYDASDCKIFYTADSWSDPYATWKQVWDAFTNDSNCVKGSTKHPTSISGGFKPYGPGTFSG